MSLDGEAPELPVHHQSPRETQSDFSVDLPGTAPAKDGSQMIKFGIQPLQPGELVPPQQLLRCLLRESQEEHSTPVADGGQLPAGLQLFTGVLTNRLQHREAWLAGR